MLLISSKPIFRVLQYGSIEIDKVLTDPWDDGACNYVYRERLVVRGKPGRYWTTITQSIFYGSYFLDEYSYLDEP